MFRPLIFKLYFIFLVFLFSQTSYCIDNPKTNDSHFQVKWIGSFSSKSDLNISTGFFKKLKNIIFGSDEFTLTKPINLIATDTNRFCILDQGLKSIIYVDRDDNKFIRSNNEESYFRSLVGVAKISDDKYIFTDSKNEKIYELNSNTMAIKVLNDSLKLAQPTGIAFNRSKNEIVVTETMQHQITVLNMKGEIKRIIGQRGTDSAQFNYPTFITIDKKNYLYVVDAMNFRVQVFDENYNLKYIIGQHGDAAGYISAAKGIAVDSYGHIFLADGMLQSVQIFDINGNFLYSFGSEGSNNSEFRMPAGISIDNDNKIYIADSYNSRIQVFQIIEDK